MYVATMQNDARPISAICAPGPGGNDWRVGKAGVTRIVPYLENGKIWFAVYTGDWLAYRANGALIEHVWYGEAPEE